ncbi:dienelactone hydrolase family protein [Ornithinimicrobium flavum]|uniref:dienelactone hydrolase family protein n=1 Tax=Ornithinimicrobium flavum TaxID=1288636 RepID=UPI001476F29C|nr:dienelactone hydrolase family protein [Ornithinimicrobium flavum]
MSAPAAHEIPAPDGPLPGLLWRPAGDGPAPALVVLQEIFGVGRYIQERCAELADQGYAVLAPQLYARLGEGEGDGDAPAEADADGIPVVEQPAAEGGLEAGMALAQRVDWETAARDGLAALEELRGLDGVDGDRVGLLGFCFGGGLAFDVAARATDAGRPPAALVSYYGSALPGLLARAEKVTCPSLHHFGTADAFIPMPAVEEVRAAVTADGTRPQVRFELHEGAGHAFDNPDPMFHHATASAAAGEQTRAFLAEVLPVPD